MKVSSEEKVSEEYVESELPDAWWNRVYLAVAVFTIFIISALAFFSWYFS